jgi:RNA polymerase sigma factor (sigma-70 family)
MLTRMSDVDVPMPHTRAAFDEHAMNRASEPIDRAASDRAVDFSAVYQRHYRDVYRYVLGLTRSPEEAEDIAAETFEHALRAMRRGVGPRERALPWLLLTSRRIATDRWRRMRRSARFALEGRGLRIDRTDEQHVDFWLWFDSLSTVLSTRQREVLLLRYRRDLTDTEIGTILGISESGVRSLVARALAVLRDHPEVLP